MLLLGFLSVPGTLLEVLGLPLEIVLLFDLWVEFGRFPPGIYPFSVHFVPLLVGLCLFLRVPSGSVKPGSSLETLAPA